MYQSFGTPFVNLLNFIINAFLNSVLIHASRSFVFVLCNLKWTPLWTGFLSSKNKPKQQWSLFWTTTTKKTRKGENFHWTFSLFYLKFKKFYVCSERVLMCSTVFAIYGTILYSMMQQQYVEWATINKKKEKRSFTLVMHTHTHTGLLTVAMTTKHTQQSTEMSRLILRTGD